MGWSMWFASRALAKIGAVAVCPTMPAQLARRRCGSDRDSRAEPDGACCVFPRAARRAG